MNFEQTQQFSLSALTEKLAPVDVVDEIERMVRHAVGRAAYEAFIATRGGGVSWDHLKPNMWASWIEAAQAGSRAYSNIKSKLAP